MRLFLLILIVFVFSPLTAAAQKYTLDEDLLYRINFGSPDDVRVLLDKGADPNAKTRQGETALQVALARDDPDSIGMAEALIAKGADPDEPDKNGNVPLVNAIKKKQPEIVKALLDKNANYHITTVDGQTLLQFATKNGDKDSVKLIQDSLAKEQALSNSFHSADRFKLIVRNYDMSACAYQYWTYFEESRQAPDKDTDTKKKIEEAKKSLYDLSSESQKFYSPAATDSMFKTGNTVVKQIYQNLDSMVSNRNRAEQNIGQDEDEKSRCERIIASLHIDFAPVNTSDSSARGGSENTAASPDISASPAEGAPGIGTQKATH